MTRVTPLLFALLLGCGGGPSPGTSGSSGGGSSAPTPEPVTLVHASPGLHGAGLTYGELAADFDLFRAATVDHGADPEATVELLFVAMIALGEDRDAGFDYLTQVLGESDWKPSEKHAVGRRISRTAEDLFDVFRKKPQILAAYCGGTPPANYTDADLAGCRIKFDRGYSPKTQGVDGDRAAFFVDIGRGAPQPRPVKLKREGDRWTVTSWTGLLTGVVKANPDE